MKSYITNLIGVSIIISSLRIFGLPGFIVATMIVGAGLYIINEVLNNDITSKTK